ncbi:MAG TPA: NifU family protein [Nocardioidaceae bacterium]|nr:NifU family protein [Nocardioidaceae bacterium]
MIPIHPLPGPDPRTVRWKMPAGTLPVRGTSCSVPSSLADTYADGIVARTVIGEDYLDVTLGENRSWREDGARVRVAVLAALEQPEAWEVAPAGADTGASPSVGEPADDARLYDATVAALAGEVGELARSHGGAIELDSVRDGVVTVRMRGACNGCPAAELTLHARLERQLRETCPDLREVRSEGTKAGRGLLPWPRVGRRPAASR